MERLDSLEYNNGKAEFKKIEFWVTKLIHDYYLDPNT